ncbi:MAG: dockerin type I domain-containing protein [Oscillospiraceae bacterium]|nr:dockerin type I domain-containing protein [Oscillospiraceae bacterium]
MLRHVAKLQILECEALKAADVNGDGEVDAADSRLVLRFVAKLIASF